ncbi:MAG TPA: NAD(P)H-binding protein [Steroidobacteraceae bacterium]|nr:NAD(P)H-binding protein [Steroidobacteraceae bacterium]
MITGRRGVLTALAVTALTVMGTGNLCAQAKAAKPLNIVVYGGSGNIGSRIVNEAAARGHHVTVVDRSPKPELAPKGVKLVTGDALDPKDILKNVAGADVVVSSVVVRPAPTPDFALRVVKSFVEALQAQTGSRKTRLMVVGGASSLYNAEGKRIIDTFGPNVPPAMQGEVKSAVDSLDYLRTVNNISWTFFSPAGNIRPGTRTGKFRLGTETLVVDEKGQSAISMEDYAVAMVDEIERPQHVNGRFTVGY